MKNRGRAELWERMGRIVKQNCDIHMYMLRVLSCFFEKRERRKKRENFPPSSSLFYAAAASTLDGFSMLCHEERELNYAQLYAVIWERSAVKCGQLFNSAGWYCWARCARVCEHYPLLRLVHSSFEHSPVIGYAILLPLSRFSFYFDSLCVVRLSIVFD